MSATHGVVGAADVSHVDTWIHRLTKHARTGEALDLTEKWPAARSIPAQALRQVVRDSQQVKALRIRGARVYGHLDLSYTDIPYILDLSHCEFHAGLDLSKSTLKEIRLSGAMVFKAASVALSLDSCQIAGDVWLDDGFQSAGAITARGTRIGGALVLTSATLGGPTAAEDDDGQGPWSLIIDGAEIGGGIIAEGCKITGRINAVNLRAGGEVRLNRGKLRNRPGVALNLDGADIKGDFFAVDGFEADGEIRAVGARIRGQLVLIGAKLRNSGDDALSLHDADIAGGLFARDIEVDGCAHADSARIGLQLNLTGARVFNPGNAVLCLENTDIRGHIFATRMKALGEVRAVGATVTGRLDLHGADLRNPNGAALDLAYAKVRQLDLRPARAHGVVSLYRSTIGDLWTSRWVPAPSPLRATGWEISDVHGPLRSDWRAARRWLMSEQAGPTAQPWHALASVYERNGDPTGGRHLRFAAAQQITRQSPWRTKIVRWGYWALVGHGYYPLLAAVWLGVAVFLSWAFVSNKSADIVPVNAKDAVSAYTAATGQVPQRSITAETPCERLRPTPTRQEVSPPYPCFNSLAFTFNNVLPTTGASASPAWTIAPHATVLLTVVFPLLKLSAWAFAALLLGGVTGLLRKT